MSDLVTDIKSLEIETLKNLKSSKALNTQKTLNLSHFFAPLTPIFVILLFPPSVVAF